MASDKSDEDAANERSSCKKCLETGALVFSWIVMGMYAEISGPTLADLKLRLNTGYEELAVALSARGVGTFPGCLIGGLLVDKFSIYSHFILALTLDIAAVAVLFVPWVSKVIYVWLLCFISGFVQSIHNAAGTRIILNIWKDKSASPVILMHLGYGIGSFLAPLYADPFLAEKVENTTAVNETIVSGPSKEIIDEINSTGGSIGNSSTCEGFTYFTESSIEYAYAISAIATASLSVPFFIFQIIENNFMKQLKDRNQERCINVKNEKTNTMESTTEKRKIDLPSDADDNRCSKGKEDDNICSKGKEDDNICSKGKEDDNICSKGKEDDNICSKGKEDDDRCSKGKDLLQLINPASCAKGRFCYGFSILFSMFFYFGNSGGGQGLISNFIRSFSIDQLNFSKSDGSLINTCLWISFSLGRFVFFILARWISVQVLIVIETCGAMGSAILMAIFADDNPLALWVLIQPIGFFWGPLWPTGVAWTDYHMELTGMGMASQMLGAAAGNIFHMRLIGYLYDNIGPLTYLYHVAGSAIFGFILAVALDIIGARHGNRFTSISDETKEQAAEEKELQFQKKETEVERYTTRL